MVGKYGAQPTIMLRDMTANQAKRKMLMTHR
jgi:hypothetical protein